MTTGKLSRSAIVWTTGKSIELWDGHELVRRWAGEMAKLADLNPGVPSARGIAQRGDNWFVYTSDDGRRWAAKLSSLLGNNNTLGFGPLDDSVLPKVPERLGPGQLGQPPGIPVRRIKMRLILAQAFNLPNKPIRRIPVGTKEAWTDLHRQGTKFSLARSDGSQEEVLVVNARWESMTYDRAWIRMSTPASSPAETA